MNKEDLKPMKDTMTEDNLSKVREIARKFNKISKIVHEIRGLCFDLDYEFSFEEMMKEYNHYHMLSDLNAFGIPFLLNYVDKNDLIKGDKK